MTSGGFYREGFGPGFYTGDGASYPPRPPVHEPATIVITVGGTDITDLVRYSGCTFRAVANGQPGECRIPIKDPTSDPETGPDFPDIGDEIILTIDGDVAWGGWVMGRSYEYAFPVEDTQDVQDMTRFVVINGVDWNFLFSRRFVFDQSDPTKEIPEYDADTQDDEVIADIVTNHLSDDLTDLGFDLTSGVTNIGSPGEFEKFRVAAIGDNWGTVMSRMTLNLGALFYIDPDKVLRWVDDETVTAPYILTDTFHGATKKGYRAVSIRSSAEVLCNDIFVRGTGAGSPKMAVKRLQNSTSIDRFGRWQYAELHSDMYKQDTVDIRASTYINGSPQNKRGHKNPFDRVSAVIFAHGFRVGQVVQFESDVHGWEDTIPIREMTMTFPVPGYVRYELLLSHEIDPGLQFADWPGPAPKNGLPWGEDILCDRNEVTDTFTREASCVRYGFYLGPHRHERDPIFWESLGRYVYNEYTESDWWGPLFQDWTNEYLDPETYGEYPTELWDCPESVGLGGAQAVDIDFPLTIGAYADTDCDETIDLMDPDASWGTSDSGQEWQVGTQNPNRLVSFYMSDGWAAYDVGPQTGSPIAECDISLGLGTLSYPIEMYWENRFEDGRLPGTVINPGSMFWTLGNPATSTRDQVEYSRVGGGLGNFYIRPSGSFLVSELNDYGVIDVTEPFALRVLLTEDTMYAKVWQLTDEEPFGWQISEDRSGTPTNRFYVQGSGGESNILYYIDNLTLVGVLGGCQFFTTYPYEDGTLKVSVDGVNVTVLETGDRSFEIPSYTSGVIQASYVRSDAYEGDEASYTDNPNAPNSYSGGGSGEWQWPCEGYITQEYGCTGFGLEPPRGSCAHFHDGIDIANTSGTPLYAPAAGTINYVGWNPYDISGNPAYIVVIDVPGGYQIGMAHLLPIKKVFAGQSVQKGQLVGLMGSTGNSTGSHVHFEARWNGDDFNPRLKLEGSP